MSGKAKSITTTLNLHGQSEEHVFEAVKLILSRGGCLSCGRMAILRVDFGDPVQPGTAGIAGVIEE
jgi:hypothetical protein